MFFKTLVVSPVLQVFATQKARATSRIYQVFKIYDCSLVVDPANIRSRYRTSGFRKIVSIIITTVICVRNVKIEPFNFYAIVSTRSALSSMLKEEVVCFRADNVPGIVIRSTGSKKVRICAKYYTCCIFVDLRYRSHPSRCCGCSLNAAPT